MFQSAVIVKKFVVMNKAVGVLLVLVASLSWSTAGLFTRVVTTDIPTTLFWRSVFGFACVLIVYLLTTPKETRSNPLKFTRDEWIISIVAGVAMICFISAFFHTTIANVSFVYGAAPLVTVVLGWLLLKNKPSSTTMFAAFLAFVGVGVLAWGGQTFSDQLGLMLAAGMTILMASIAVLVKFFPNQNSGKTAYLSALCAALITAPFVGDFSLDASNAFWLATYGIVNVGFGFGFYLWGATKITPATAALVGMLEVPLAPIWAAWLFDESMTALVVSGGALVIAAAVLHIWHTRRE